MTGAVTRRWAYGTIDRIGCMVEFESLSGFTAYNVRWERHADAWLATRVRQDGEGLQHLTTAHQSYFIGTAALFTALQPWLEAEFDLNVLDFELARAALRTLLDEAVAQHRTDPTPRHTDIATAAQATDWFCSAQDFVSPLRAELGFVV